MPVEIKIKYNTLQKKPENFCHYEICLAKQQLFFVNLMNYAYFSVNSTFDTM